MNAQATTANVKTLATAITTPRNVLTASPYDPSGNEPLGWASVPGMTPEQGGACGLRGRWSFVGGRAYGCAWDDRA
jgi:hypothetical protein